MIIELVRPFYLKNVPAKFQKYLKHISWVSAGQVRQTCRATLVIAPEAPVATIVTICCNHRDGEYFLHRITRKLGSTATSTVIAWLLLLTDYISGAENETLRALSGHTNGNIEMRSPSARPWWRWLQLQPSCGSPQWVADAKLVCVCVIL